MENININLKFTENDLFKTFMRKDKGRFSTLDMAI